MKRIVLFFLLGMICFNVFSQEDITQRELKEHIQFLTSEKMLEDIPVERKTDGLPST